MSSLSKTIFNMPPQIRQKLFSGEYERVGGIIREKSTGEITYLLVDKLDEEKEGFSISISKPEILESTLQHLTAEQIRKNIKLVEKELDAQNIQIKPDDLTKIENTVNIILLKSNIIEQAQQINGMMLELYSKYHHIFKKYQRDLDRPKNLQSFPFIKILILIAVSTSKIWMQLKDFKESEEWVLRVYKDIIESMKIYCLLNGKSDMDSAHYLAISKLQAPEFINELKEIISSPPDKPKYKFPPIEVIYLWNCVEYLEGYLIELKNA